MYTTMSYLDLAHENCLNICRHWFRVTLLANFDFSPCLRVKFHKSLFWVPILAAGGPYWVPISPKNGSISQSLGVPISYTVSVKGSLFWGPSPYRDLFDFLDLYLYFRVPILYLFRLNSGEECQFSQHVLYTTMSKLDLSVLSKILHYYCVSIFGTGSVGKF